jgi:hypothetical protein
MPMEMLLPTPTWKSRTNPEPNAMGAKNGKRLNYEGRSNAAMKEGL